MAALVVVLGHVGDLFIRPRQADALPFGDALFYVATGLAHQAVMVFFVLSGFLVGGQILAEPATWSWRRYACARLARLWVVLVPALCLTAGVDWAGRTLGGAPGLYQQLDRSWSTLAGNAFFLQTVAVPTFGSNGSLWSLSNEFWYYVAFPLVTIGLTRGSLPARGASLVVLLMLALALPRGFAGGFAIWTFGAIARLRFFRIGRHLARWMKTVSAGGLFLTLWLIGTGSFGGRYSDFAVGALFAVWLHVMLAEPAVEGNDDEGTFAASARWLAGVSYSLYAIHYPLLLALRTDVPGATLSPGPRAAVVALGLVLACVVCAGLFAAITERHTASVRRWMLRTLTPSPPRAAAEPLQVSR